MGHDDLDSLPAFSGGQGAELKQVSFKVKTTILVLQLAFVGGLLAIWLLWDAVRESKSLWVLFFYSFPSEFLVAPLPHEPIFFYFGKFYSPLVVAAVSVSSTVITEALNYSIFGYFADRSFFEKVHKSRLTRRLVELFYKAPFVALMVAGLSPVPFYPMRFLVVLARYPVWKYCLAVFLSRAPRFWVLAWIGSAVQIPNWLLIVFFSVLIVAINGPIVVRLIRKTDRGGARDE
jgi:membrane protein YqaA with SNARE-associated domain